MAYTSDKKPGALSEATTPLADANEIVLSQAGTVVKASLANVEAKVFAAKTQTTTPTGTEVTIVRQTDGNLRQVPLANIVPALNITNAQISNSAAIADSKLATINTAGKVTNNAVQATSALVGGAYDNGVGASKIVARDGSGNFAAGTITATLSGNASTATTAATATQLATGRTIALTGDVTYTSPSFNGTANVTAAATLANSGVVAGTYNNNAAQVRPFTVDAKGRVTSIGSAVPIDISMTAVSDSSFKKSVAMATTTALTAGYVNGTAGVGATLTNAASPLAQLSVDGLSASAGFRILVKNQANRHQNGIYTVTNAGSNAVPWVLTRTTDADTNTEIGGAVVTVDFGVVNGGQTFSTDFKGGQTVGADVIDWHQVVTTGTSGAVSTAMIADSTSTATGVTNSKLRQSAALSVIGNSTNATAAPADIAAGTDGHVLRRSGTAVGFGTVATAGIADDAVNNSKLRNSASFSVIGRSANSAGDPDDIQAGTDGHVLRRSGTTLGFGTVGATGLNGGQTGNAPIFGVRAWCMFDGNVAGTNAPIAGGNVASVTRVSAGAYRINFTTSPGANYAVVASCITFEGGLAGINQWATAWPASSSYAEVFICDVSNVFQDGARVSVVIMA